MKRILVVIILIAMLVIGMLPAFAVGYSSDLLGVYEAKQTSLQAENTPGILPTNPFYFIKEWGRGVKRAITINPVSKAEFELRVAVHKAAELRKIQELDPENSRAVKVAFENYSEDIARLKIHITSLKAMSEDSRASEILTKITEEVSTHKDILGERRE